MSRPSGPFWLCHECHAEMRPIQRDGVPHCASCSGEFIEILDNDVNPDPFAGGPFGDLPPPPGRAPPSPDQDTNTGFFQTMFSSLLGAAGEPSQGGSSSSFPGAGNLSSGETGPRTGGREFSFSFPGGGRGSVMFGSFGGGNAGPLGGGIAPGNQAGLDAFFPGFAPGPARGQNPGNIGSLAPGQDMLGALLQMLAQEGNLPPGVRGPAAVGDYVMSENGFDQILEQLMHAAGPQGPLPATDAVIEGLPRFTFDEKTLEESIHKDCPVCQEDYSVGDEVMKVPCAHIFHPDCLQPWLKTNGSCPVCRFSLVPDEANRPAAPPTEEQGQPLLTNILNRLWGQGGATIQGDAPPPLEPATDASSNPPPPTAQPTSSSAPTQASTHSTSADSAEDDPPVPVPGLSSAIPDDYRERHRRRERDREEEQQFPSYYS